VVTLGLREVLLRREELHARAFVARSVKLTVHALRQSAFATTSVPAFGPVGSAGNGAGGAGGGTSSASAGTGTSGVHTAHVRPSHLKSRGACGVPKSNSTPTSSFVHGGACWAAAGTDTSSDTAAMARMPNQCRRGEHIVNRPLPRNDEASFLRLGRDTHFRHATSRRAQNGTFTCAAAPSPYVVP